MKNEYCIANGFIKCYSDISANLVYNSIAKHKNKKKNCSAEGSKNNNNAMPKY